MATPTEVVAAIKDLTKRSQALEGPFPQISGGLKEIVSTTTASVSRMNGMKPVSAGSDANMIFDAYSEFGRVNAALLNVLIDKADLFASTSNIGAPVARDLRSVEGAFDTLAFSLIYNVQGRAEDLKGEARRLGQTLKTAIEKYSGLA